MQNIPRNKNLISGFIVAFKGIFSTILFERNAKIHLFFGLLAIFLGFYFQISPIEWALLSITITLVFITETINTAIEMSIDLTTRKRKYRAMLGKDIAAGAVLLSVINSLIIGYILFFSRLVKLFI